MVPEVTRDTIARVRNCVLALARHHVVVFDTSIVYAFEISLEHKVRRAVGLRKFFHLDAAMLVWPLVHHYCGLLVLIFLLPVGPFPGH